MISINEKNAKPYGLKGDFSTYNTTYVKAVIAELSAAEY